MSPFLNPPWETGNKGVTRAEDPRLGRTKLASTSDLHFLRPQAGTLSQVRTLLQLSMRLSVRGRTGFARTAIAIRCRGYRIVPWSLNFLKGHRQQVKTRVTCTLRKSALRNRAKITYRSSACEAQLTMPCWQDARCDHYYCKAIEGKYVELLDDLDGRGRRRWAAVEARALGRGGIAAVARATGLSDRTIRTALRELDDPDPLAGHRQRRRGGGRKPHAVTQPALREALDRLIEPTARGSPTNPLRWTIKSTHRLAAALRDQGFQVSATSVRRMLAAMGYRLQGKRKTREGVQHPDRDGQFRHIAKRAAARKRRGEPAISVDTKKKEVLGNLKTAGQTYRPKGDPEKIRRTISPTRNSARRFPTASTTFTATRRAYRWGSATIRPSSRSRRSAAGGRSWAGSVTAAPNGCW